MMKKNDYINTALKGVNNEAKKKNIEAELDSHISESKNFYEEIGYDHERAEEIAVEHMGEAEPLAEQLAMIHNKSKLGNIAATIITIIALFITLMFSCINYYDNYNISDFETGKLCVESAITILFSLFTIHIKGDRLSILPMAFLGSLLSYFTGKFNNIGIVIQVISAIFIITNCVFVVTYNNKIAHCKNSKKDLKIKHALQIINKIVVVIFIGMAVYFIASTVTELNNTAKSYNEAIHAGIELEETIPEEGYEKAAEKYEMRRPGTDEKFSPFITEFDNVYFEIDYSPASEGYTEDFSINISPYIDFITFSSRIVYSPMRADKEMLEKVDDTNYFADKSKEEILEYFIDCKPISLTIYGDNIEEKDAEAVQYDFGYKLNNYNSMYQIVTITFDKNGNLLEVNGWD